MKNRKTRIAMPLLGVALVGAEALAQEDEDIARDHSVDEVIVFAKPLPRTVEQLAQPTSVLLGEDLIREQSTSLGETLSRQPGLRSTYFGPIASRPVIRGQGGERVRTLVNGLDTLDVAGLSDDHQVSADSLLADRVEIIYGPATLLYGSGAAGGLVNVVDRRIRETPLEKNFNLGVAAGGETALGRREVGAFTQFGNDSFTVHLDYFRRDTDDVEIPGFAESDALRASEEEEGEGEEEEEAFGTLENTDSETESGSAALTWTGQNAFLGVSVSGFQSNYGVPGAHAHEEGEEEGEEGEEEEEIIRIDLEQTRIDLRGGINLDGPISAVRLQFARNDYEHTELESGEPGTRFENDAYDTRLEVRHRPLGAFEGAIGLQYKVFDFKAAGEEAFVPVSDTRQLSLFLFEEVELNDAWVLQGSARVEQQKITADDSRFNPNFLQYDDNAFGISIGAIWRPVDDIRVSANLARTERHPNATEMFANGPHLAVQRFERGSVIQGNGLLDKETSLNFDATVHGDTGPFEWTVTGFVNRVDDYILLNPTADVEDGLQVFEFQQADAELFGYEASAQFDLIETDPSHLHIRLFTDMVRGQLRDGGNLPLIPPMRFGAGIHYRWNTLRASIDTIFGDSQTRTAEEELETADYVMLNADLSYEFADNGLLLFAKGTNLTDEDIRHHSSPLKDVAPLPGRSFHVGVRYEF